ncbi:NADH dehydrogenase [ubiquinone] 1 alpha subcomplex subunit 13-B [Camellia lanceoleosa]|uniref:NADH dehydrogenase [ubiquinone] 1 alpha subcomplex subunit 13-B n=1 Tax=Camellia lanceoleosa TaxID=1840588 RepID=A0ACC0GQ17_9ERIC|nr:NADH dehydrogenase [ubiquinone] 1 alpha subcomplex subunit 13-B [Camellia lanceoleosa]
MLSSLVVAGREWHDDGLVEFAWKLLLRFISFVTLLGLYETSSKGGKVYLLGYHACHCQFPSHLFRELKEEKYAVCKAILPILQAEEDERFVKEWK